MAKRWLYLICFGSLFLFCVEGCGVTSKTGESTTVPNIDSTTIVEAEPVEPEPKRLPPFTLADVPETPREFRGVWVATVDNIDWPTEPGLPVAQQKAELIAILEQAAFLNLNAIILQVRPSADALYPSPYEPWAEYLTGKQGEAPEPYYDPLQFAIEQAHRRGLELHAWFNPFRAYHPAAETGFAPGHVINEHPEWVVKYGDYYWLDPGQKAARQYSIKVIVDVVRRYNIDGVHLDDYFYPYPRFDSDREAVPFPDENSYAAYIQFHEPTTRDDWRRQNVNTFVKKLGKAIHKADSTILFGISPFGIWRPGHPSQITGLDAYARIFADSRKWLRKGWVDYLAPQLYWPIGEPGQSFPVLLHWWSQQNHKDKFLWPGLYTSRVINYPEYGWHLNEIINQIKLSRNTEGVSGHIHFSMQAFMGNSGNISEQLINGLYSKPALVPGAAWIPGHRPAKPDALLKRYSDQIIMNLSPQDNHIPWLWVVKVRYTNDWELYFYPGYEQKIAIPGKTKKGSFIGAAVSAVNESGGESTPVLLFLPYSLTETAAF